MASPALNPLVEKIRGKYPGAYDDMDDAALTKAILAKYPQYSDLAAPAVQKPTAPNMQQVYLDTGQPQKPDVLNRVGQMAGDTAQNIGQISAPGIAASLVNQFWPNAGSKAQQVIGIIPTQGATPLKDLGNQIAVTGLPMMAGGLEQGEAPARPTMARPAAAAAEEASPGIASRVAEILKRRAVGKIPGIQLAKDLNYVINGSAEAAPPTPKPPTPQTPDWWGKGQYGSPVSQWGQRIPAPAESPKSAEIPASKVSTTPPKSSTPVSEMTKAQLLNRVRENAQNIQKQPAAVPQEQGRPLQMAGQNVPANTDLTAGLKVPQARVEGKVMQVARRQGLGMTIGRDTLMEAPELRGIAPAQVEQAVTKLGKEGKIFHEPTGGGAHAPSYTIALKKR